jgi:endonuclease III
MNQPGDDLKARINKVLHLLDGETQSMVSPALDQLVSEFGKDPFIILIGCLLSLRTRDTTTVLVARELFSHVKTPEQMLSLPMRDLEKMLYSIGFYRKKAWVLKRVSQQLVDQFQGQVPSSKEALLSLEGVGQKTANAVLGYAFGIPALCVDTHVHQMANRLGWVSTKTPDQTEKELMKIVPKHYWIRLNYLFVVWGQNVCLPRFPHCSTCAIRAWCPRRGVTKSR